MIILIIIVCNGNTACKHSGYGIASYQHLPLLIVLNIATVVDLELLFFYKADCKCVI